MEDSKFYADSKNVYFIQCKMNDHREISKKQFKKMDFKQKFKPFFKIPIERLPDDLEISNQENLRKKFQKKCEVKKI